MKLKRIIKYKVEVIVKTGLHIGAGKDSVKIGGIDDPVVKLKNGMPFIPGSSLKGKLRSLLELKLGVKLNEDGIHVPTDNCYKNCPICRFFGYANNSKNNKINLIGPTRFIFRDLYLTQEWQEKFKAMQEDIDKGFYEIKRENTINRKTGATKRGGIRVIERVPIGVKFTGELILKEFEKTEGDPEEIDSDQTLLNETLGGEMLQELKNLLENDYLGGSGTRGYGQVEINFIKVIEE